MRLPFRAPACLAAAALVWGAAPLAAADRDDARVAVASAKAKIEAGDRAGVGGQAADVQARARAALDQAQMRLAKKDENRAFTYARQAEALADLAAATAEMRRLEGERDALARP